MARKESHILIRGRKLLHLMNQRGLSAAQLARAAGVSPTTISAVLTRSQRVTPRTARRITEALKKNPPIDGLVELLDDEVA